MNFLDQIAEARIRDAIARGDFDELPGRGEPLDLEDLSRVPEDLRASYILCKSAGFLPEEMQLRKDVLTLRDLIAACTDERERVTMRERLNAAALRLAMLRERRGDNAAWRRYGSRVFARLSSPLR